MSLKNSMFTDQARKKIRDAIKAAKAQKTRKAAENFEKKYEEFENTKSKPSPSSTNNDAAKAAAERVRIQEEVNSINLDTKNKDKRTAQEVLNQQKNNEEKARLESEAKAEQDRKNKEHEKNYKEFNLSKENLSFKIKQAQDLHQQYLKAQKEFNFKNEFLEKIDVQIQSLTSALNSAKDEKNFKETNIEALNNELLEYFNTIDKLNQEYKKILEECINKSQEPIVDNSDVQKELEEAKERNRVAAEKEADSIENSKRSKDALDKTKADFDKPDYNLYLDQEAVDSINGENQNVVEEISRSTASINVYKIANQNLDNQIYNNQEVVNSESATLENIKLENQGLDEQSQSLENLVSQAELYTQESEAKTDQKKKDCDLLNQNTVVNKQPVYTESSNIGTDSQSGLAIETVNLKQDEQAFASSNGTFSGLQQRPSNLDNNTAVSFGYVGNEFGKPLVNLIGSNSSFNVDISSQPSIVINTYNVAKLSQNSNNSCPSDLDWFSNTSSQCFTYDNTASASSVTRKENTIGNRNPLEVASAVNDDIHNGIEKLGDAAMAATLPKVTSIVGSFNASFQSFVERGYDIFNMFKEKLHNDAVEIHDAFTSPVNDLVPSSDQQAGSFISQEKKSGASDPANTGMPAQNVGLVNQTLDAINAEVVAKLANDEALGALRHKVTEILRFRSEKLHEYLREHLEEAIELLPNSDRYTEFNKDVTGQTLPFKDPIGIKLNSISKHSWYNLSIDNGKGKAHPLGVKSSYGTMTKNKFYATYNNSRLDPKDGIKYLLTEVIGEPGKEQKSPVYKNGKAHYVECKAIMDIARKLESNVKVSQEDKAALSNMDDNEIFKLKCQDPAFIAIHQDAKISCDFFNNYANYFDDTNNYGYDPLKTVSIEDIDSHYQA